MCCFFFLFFSPSDSGCTLLFCGLLEPEVFLLPGVSPCADGPQHVLSFLICPETQIINSQHKLTHSLEGRTQRCGHAQETEYLPVAPSAFLPLSSHTEPPLSRSSLLSLSLSLVVNALGRLLLTGRTCRRGHVRGGSGSGCHIKVRVPPADRRNSAADLLQTGLDRNHRR